MFLGWVLRSEFLKLLVVCGGGFFGLLLWVFFFCGCVDFNWGVVAGFGGWQWVWIDGFQFSK